MQGREKFEWGRDGALLPGRTFTDPEYGISITTVSADASGLTVRVTVPPQTCVHGTPGVGAVSPAGQTGTIGTTSTYTVTLTNTDSAGCQPNTFRYLPYSNSSLDLVADPDFLTLAPGASATVTLAADAAPLTTTGTYTATGVFRSNTPGTGDAAVSATYTLSAAADTAAPAAPADVRATALGSDSVQLSWAPGVDNVGVVGYRVTRSGAMFTTGDSSFTDGGLSAGTPYSYSVQAFDRRGNLSPATTVSVTSAAKTDSSPPTAPTVTATAADHSLTVSWTRSSDNVGVAYYRVYPCLVSQCMVPAGVRSFTVEGLPTRTKYDLQVIALDGDGNQSNLGLGTYPVYMAAAGTAAPSQPRQFISPSGGYHRVELTWQPSSDDRGVVRYDVYRNNRRIASVTSTSYTDTVVGAPSQYHVQAVDGDGSVSAPSMKMSFPAAYMESADSTSPDAAIVSPAGGTVSGAVEVTASASDDVKVTNVQLYVDGVFLTNKTTAPYTFSWDTTAVANGTHWLYVRAYDAAGNYGTAGVTSVSVANAGAPDSTPPSVAITAPVYGASVSSAVTVAATATDDEAMAKVVFAVDGAAVATDTTAPYSATWDASGAYAGSHMITATAYDAAGNTSTALVAVTRPAPADGNPPTVSFSAPANGATVSGTVGVTATASDDKGVSKVEFSVDGTVVASFTSAPYSFNWSASQASAGSHTIVATAFDAAGNSSTAQLSVTVAGDTVAPRTPSNLKALVIGTTQVALSWTASTDDVGVTGYEVLRDGIQVAETSLPNYLDANLVPGSSHKYQVRARDASGNRSSLSSALSVRLVALSTSGTGTIAGVVYDAAGKPLANAVVQLTGAATTKSAKTGSNGTYKFSSLAPGDYTVTMSAGTTAASVGAGTPSTTVVGGVTTLVVSRG